ncbi:MAG TPA: linear amide C-N hydrolase [Methanocella sp.]|nr:linear amide C-N hydrolase [Methanocella sp.]
MCSRIVWKGRNGKPVIVGRNMDWFEDMKTNLWIFPAGIERDGLTAVNPLKWTSKYGSLVATAYDLGAADGMNEKRLDGNALFLSESSYGGRDEDLPGLTLSLWLQFYLDNFSTVEEAISYTEKHPYQLRPTTAGLAEKKTIRLHLSLSDITGDTAIIEYVDGERLVYHDRRYRVMTNSPTYDQQIEGLKRYKGFGGTSDLPGSAKAADRFVRAAFYLQQLPDDPGSERQAIASVISVMRNITQPFGISAPDEPNTSPTRWRTIADLTSGFYYFESTTSPFIIWVDTGKIDFCMGSGVRKLDLADSPDRIGNVTSQFQPAAPYEPLEPDPEETSVSDTAIA